MSDTPLFNLKAWNAQYIWTSGLLRALINTFPGYIPISTVSGFHGTLIQPWQQEWVPLESV